MNTLICTLVAVCLVSKTMAAQEGSICSGDSDCSGVTGLTCRIQNPCKKGYCACPRGQTSITASGNYGTACQTPQASSTPTPVKLGATCSQNSDCTGYPTATCQNSQCQCISSLTAAKDGIRCQPFSNGAQCNAANNAVCGSTSNGDCSGGTCACSSGYTWVTSGDIAEPGGCVSTSSTVNVGEGKACSGVNWMTQAASSVKLCAEKLHCGICPEGGNYCMSGATSLTVAMVTLSLAALCSLLLSRV